MQRNKQWLLGLASLICCDLLFAHLWGQRVHQQVEATLQALHETHPELSWQYERGWFSSHCHLTMQNRWLLWRATPLEMDIDIHHAPHYLAAPLQWEAQASFLQGIQQTLNGQTNWLGTTTIDVMGPINGEIRWVVSDGDMRGHLETKQLKLPPVRWSSMTETTVENTNVDFSGRLQEGELAFDTLEASAGRLILLGSETETFINNAVFTLSTTAQDEPPFVDKSVALKVESIQKLEDSEMSLLSQTLSSQLVIQHLAPEVLQQAWKQLKASQSSLSWSGMKAALETVQSTLPTMQVMLFSKTNQGDIQLSGNLSTNLAVKSKSVLSWVMQKLPAGWSLLSLFNGKMEIELPSELVKRYMPNTLFVKLNEHGAISVKQSQVQCTLILKDSEMMINGVGVLPLILQVSSSLLLNN